MIVYNDLRHLTDDTAAAVTKFVAGLTNAGMSVKIGETYRTAERQAALYRKSQERIAKGLPPLTKTLHSWHLVGRAADIDIFPATMENIAKYAELAQALGFHTHMDPAEVQGDIVKGVKTPPYWDWHHVEYRGGLPYETAYAQYNELGRAPINRAGLAGIMQAGTIFGAIYGLLKGNQQ